MSAIYLLERGARLNPDGAFLGAEGLSIRYAEALSWCRRLARALREHGFKPGEHAAILSGNDPYAYLTHIAIAAAGLRYIPLHPMTSPADAVRVLKKLDCDLLFHQQAAEPMVAAPPANSRRWRPTSWCWRSGRTWTCRCWRTCLVGRSPTAWSRSGRT